MELDAGSVLAAGDDLEVWDDEAGRDDSDNDERCGIPRPDMDHNNHHSK